MLNLKEELSNSDDRNAAFFNYQKASHRLLSDDKGGPLTVYHATSHQFEMFYPLSHFGTFQAAQTRIKSFSETKHLAFSMYENAGSEKEIGNAIGFILNDLLKMQKGEKTKKYRHEPVTIPAHLVLSNPKIMPEIGFYRSGYKNDLMYRLIEDDLLFGFRFFKHANKAMQQVMALRSILNQVKVPPIYDFIFKNPFQISDEAVRYELGLECLYPILGKNDLNNEYKELKDHSLNKNEFVNRSHLSMQRMIRYWENLGYDGFIYEDTVDDLVENRGNLPSVVRKIILPSMTPENGRGAFSYVVFRPGQVIRLDRPAEYLKEPLYPSAKNQQKLDAIRDNTLSYMEPRLLTRQEKSRMQAEYYESKRFYALTRE